jgi:hypothetical protein
MDDNGTNGYLALFFGLPGLFLGLGHELYIDSFCTQNNKIKKTPITFKWAQNGLSLTYSKTRELSRRVEGVIGVSSVF